MRQEYGSEHGRDAQVAARLTALEQRVDALEASAGEQVAAAGRPTDREDWFWALTGLREQSPEGGAVLFAGMIRLSEHEQYEWQWGEPGGVLLDTDWSLLAPALSALAHPVRLQLLKEVLTGTHAVAELQAGGSFGTSGQVYHHLRQLVSTGWLRPAGRGSYAIPPDRVIPLMVILSAARTRPHPS